MKKQSLWLDPAEPGKCPELQGGISVDVLVAGGGITGVTTACLLKEAESRVALVDQHEIGGGETGHTTAHVTYVTDARLYELVDRLGSKPAAAFWDAGFAAMDEIRHLTARHRIDCELKQAPGYLFAAVNKDTAKEKAALERDADLAREFGFEAEFVESDPLFGRPAVRFPNQLKFHPLKYLHALAKTLPGGGSHVFCNTSGSEVDAENHELRTKHGKIRYQALVAATHTPIQGERGTFGAALFQTKLAAYSTYAIEAEIEALPEALYWDTNDPYLYLRIDRRDGRYSAILGGEDHKTGQYDDTEACYRRLEETLKKIFPKSRLRHRWSGQVLETPDGLPYFGEVGERQFVATGFAGNGMTLGTCGAMLIRDLIAGKGDRWNGLFSPQRKAFAGAWDYLRENKDYPTHLIKDHLRPAAALEDLSPNAGAVVRIDGKKCAVYCDAHGRRTVLSAVCPHMGCIVAWNDAEKTWDCPCHGSRFFATGGLLAGPAESGLAPAGGG